MKTMCSVRDNRSSGIQPTQKTSPLWRWLVHEKANARCRKQQKNTLESNKQYVWVNCNWIFLIFVSLKTFHFFIGNYLPKVFWNKSVPIFSPSTSAFFMAAAFVLPKTVDIAYLLFTKRRDTKEDAANPIPIIMFRASVRKTASRMLDSSAKGSLSLWPPVTASLVVIDDIVLLLGWRAPRCFWRSDEYSRLYSPCFRIYFLASVSSFIVTLPRFK